MTLPAFRYRDRAEERKGTEEPPNHGFAFDIDGVIDAFPRETGTLITALTAAGHRVFIITGAGGEEVQPSDVQGKLQFLGSLGLSPESYYELIVLPQPHAENKAKAIEANGIGVLVDNNRDNIRAATAAGCVGLYLYNTREH
jgi:hypothetical protein